MNPHLPDPPAAPPHRGPPNICHSLLVVARCSLFVASRPAGNRCPPRIRVIRLESLPRARRDALWHPRLPPCEQKTLFTTTTQRHEEYLITCPLLCVLLLLLRLVIFSRLFQLPGSGFQVPSRCAGTCAIQQSLFRNTLPPTSASSL